MNIALIISWKKLLQFSIALFFFLFCLVCCLVVRNVSQSEMTIFLTLSAAAVYYNCTKKQPEIYVQHAKGGTYFGYIFCWYRVLGRISPYENWDVCSPNSYLGEGKKKRRIFFFYFAGTRKHPMPPPPHQIGLIRVLIAEAEAKSSNSSSKGEWKLPRSTLLRRNKKVCKK